MGGTTEPHTLTHSRAGGEGGNHSQQEKKNTSSNLHPPSTAQGTGWVFRQLLAGSCWVPTAQQRRGNQPRYSQDRRKTRNLRDGKPGETEQFPPPCTPRPVQKGQRSQGEVIEVLLSWLLCLAHTDRHCPPVGLQLQHQCFDQPRVGSAESSPGDRRSLEAGRLSWEAQITLESSSGQCGCA